MFEIAQNFAEVFGILLFIIWTISGYRVGRLVFRRTRGKLQRSARWNLVQLGINAAVILLQIAMVGLSWAVDWNFASNRVVVALPLLVVPAIAVAVLSVPRLRAISRSKPEDRAAPLPLQDRARASDPLLVVPVHAAAIGAFLDFWNVFIERPAPPYGVNLLVNWPLLVVATGLLYLRQRRRQRILLGRETVSGGRWYVRGLRTVGAVALVAVVAVTWSVIGIKTSRLPDHLNMTTMKNMDYGGGPTDPTHNHNPGPGQGQGHEGAGARSVTDLTGPRDGTPTVKYTLTAEQKQIKLASGRTIDGLVFNGQAPGPQLTMHVDDLVEVTLVNKLSDEGVTLHWHGLDIPNAEDGVAGITQDDVLPGQSYTYRFRPEQVGTFWYHSHQVSEEAVDRGLFGPLVVLPKGAPIGAEGLDTTIMAHSWKDSTTGGTTTEWGGGGDVVAMGTSDTLDRRAIAPGVPVKLRLINTSDDPTADAKPRTFTLSGTPFKVSAIDGSDLNRPGDLTNTRLEMAVGGRYDLTFTMPDHPVRLTDLTNPSGGLLLSPDGKGDVANPVSADAPVFDPIGYGGPAATPFSSAGPFNRQFTLVLDDRLSFFDGHLFPRPVINGHTFPEAPMLMVAEGDLVKMTYINRGHLDHPMHLHGHHLLVLSHNGKKATGSPWWTDTLNIKPGEILEVAFRADNPGLWMDHCHNLQHASQGMIMHLGYLGVTTPYEIGHATTNHPE
ncbi:MAG: multicopper oxidase family protein [Labedaea sp.]